RRGHHRGKDGLSHLRYIVDSMIRQRAPWILILLMLIPVPAAAQTYSAPQARRQWVTFSYDWQYTYPLHFAEFPLEDLVGRDVTTADPPYDYRTRDGST